VAIRITDPDTDLDPDPYGNTDKTCLGGGMHCPSASSSCCFSWSVVTDSFLYAFLYLLYITTFFVTVRCTSYSNSVRLSVCLSHAGIVSKRLHVARCSLHCQIAKCVKFC